MTHLTAFTAGYITGRFFGKQIDTAILNTAMPVALDLFIPGGRQKTTIPPVNPAECLGKVVEGLKNVSRN